MPAKPAGVGPAYAALDLGTNNCRLLVATPDGDGFRVVDGFSRIIRLGEGLERRGRLGRRAMERAIAALRVCARKINRFDVRLARSVATEACRRASNGHEFQARVFGETGLSLEIISPQEEAALMLAGCAPLLDQKSDRALVFDIGGGSTEIVWAEVGAGPGNITAIDCLSIPIGVVNLSERHGKARMDRAEYENLVAVFAQQIAGFGLDHDIFGAVASGAVQMLGSSGTVTTLAGMHLGLPCYDRKAVDGSFLDFGDVEQITERLLAMGPEGRASQPCIGRARADLVLAGCAILDAICRSWPVGRLRVADRGLREGILCALMQAANDGLVEA